MQWRAVRNSRVTLTAAVLATSSTVLEELDEDVVAPLLVHQRGAGRARRQHVDDGRQFLVVDFDRGGDVLRLGARARHTHHHDLADIADLACREDRFR
jgi:hypothetical protein